MRRGLGDEGVFEDRVDQVPVGGAPRVVVEAFVGRELELAERAAQVGPELLGEAGGEEVRAVRALVIAVRHHRRMAAAQTGRRFAAAHGFAVARNRAEQCGREQRGVELLADPRAFAVQQRRADAEGQHRRGAEVGQRRANAHRQPAGLTGHVHQPGDSLHDRGVGRPCGIRSALAEGRCAGVDDLRIDRHHGVVANAQAIDRAGAEVLDDHVGVLRQAQEHRATSGRLEIEAQAALVAVLREKLHALAVDELVAQVARQVAALGFLDLDHVGPQVAEQHRADRAGGHHAQVQDHVAVQRQARRGVAHRCLRAGRFRRPGNGPG